MAVATTRHAGRAAPLGPLPTRGRWIVTDADKQKTMYAVKALLLDRIDAVEAFLIGAKCLVEQKHLDVGTESRDYWNFGYLMGLKDAYNLTFNNPTPSDTE